MKDRFIIPLLTFALLLNACQKDDAVSFSIKTGDSVKADTVRLVSYNILEGMKLDKASNYDDFVAWVNKVKPDILSLEEANKFTQATLTSLASRWGHQYVVTNIKSDDNYPVALTSRYPVTVVKKINDGVSHGAIYVRIKGVNIVVLHLWPQAYARGGATGTWASDKTHDYDSDGDVDGDDYRINEINIYLSQTIKAYPEETRWLMMGDFNSSSPLDSTFLSSSTRSYSVHKTILSSSYHDMIRTMHAEFTRSCPTVYGGWTGIGSGSRIDFIYGTQAMTGDIVKANYIYDVFTDNYSDHYPAMLDFRIYE